MAFGIREYGGAGYSSKIQVNDRIFKNYLQTSG